MSKTRPPLGLLLALLAFAFLSLAAGAQPKVAVLDISVPKEIDQSVIVPVTETLMEEIVASKAFVVLDRAYIDQIFKEKEFSLSGLVSDSQVAEVGQFLGANYVVAGKAQLIGDSYFVVAKMIDVKTGVITAQASAQGEGKLSILVDLARNVGRKLSSGGTAKTDAGAVFGETIKPAPAGSATQSTVAPAVAAPSAPAIQAAPAAMPTAAVAPRQAGKIRVGFVMHEKEGGIDDLPGPWETGLARAKERLGDKFEAVVLWDVQTDDAGKAFEKLAGQERCTLIFSSINWFFEDMAKSAARHPDVIFESWGGWDEGIANLGSFDVDNYDLFYLAGVAAASLSANGKLGYILDGVQPYTIRQINEFALGAKAANPKATVSMKLLPDGWWEDDPEAAADAASALLAEGCDAFGPIDDLDALEILRKAASKGKRLYGFASWLPLAAAPELLVSAPLEDWSVIYEKVIADALAGTWKREELVMGMKDGAAKFGGVGERFNPIFVPPLRAKRVKTADMGEVPALDLIERRAESMKRGEFFPLIGPIKDQRGSLRIKDGQRADQDFIDSIDWLVDNIKGNLPKN